MQKKGRLAGALVINDSEVEVARDRSLRWTPLSCGVCSAAVHPGRPLIRRAQSFRWLNKRAQSQLSLFGLFVLIGLKNFFYLLKSSFLLLTQKTRAHWMQRHVALAGAAGIECSTILI
ncbi:MAG: hypothetical protein IJR52_12555 [Selenomonadaceae bacterium]|nr:hypothetical protein [Selenomonadaceae bacterium]